MLKKKKKVFTSLKQEFWKTVWNLFIFEGQSHFCKTLMQRVD